MLRITLAAALVTLPVAARADVPAVTVGQPVDYGASAPGTMTWKVSLRANTYYAFGTLIETNGSVHVVLKDASGNTQAEEFYNNQSPVSGGGSFEAPYSGDYFITATAEARNGDVSASGRFFVNVDCANGINTICTLPVGKVRTDRQFDYYGDGDWFKTSLRAGKRYTVTLSWPTRQPADCFVVRAFDAKGRAIKTGRATVRPNGSITTSFTARANGRAFIGASFACGYGAPLYNIGLALRK
jgi:hypothetical protein